MYSMIDVPPSYSGGFHAIVNEDFVIPDISRGPLGGPGLSTIKNIKCQFYFYQYNALDSSVNQTI